MTRLSGSILVVSDPRHHLFGYADPRAFWDYEKGISLGCPLSPLIGAFFLNALVAAAAKLHLFYVRFMTTSSFSPQPAGSCAAR
jgi:hypothetical protein